MNNNFIIFLIKKYIKSDEYINLYYTSKNISKELYDIPYHIKYDFCKKRLNEYPSQFFDYFNPIKLYNTKKINLGNRIGSTHYIDFINLSDFKKNNTNILRGIDIFNRPFLSLLYNDNLRSSIDELNVDKSFKNKKIITLFQRYSDNKYNWTIGGDQLVGKYISSLYFDYNILYKSDEPINILKDLFNNNKTSYSYIYFDNNIYIYDLELYN
jgi:hypothetical protein